MKLEDIHVGESYQVRDWDDMAEEYGVGDNGSILVPHGFPKCMRSLCGKIFTVLSIGTHKNIRSAERIEGPFFIDAAMLQPLFPEASKDNFKPVDLSGFLM